MTQKEMATYFKIPLRTIENWEGGRRNPPSYLLDLIEYKLKKEDLIMDTMFNQEKIKIITRESGGDVEYKYSFFKVGFEEWARDLNMHLPDIEALEIYLKECGYKIMEIKEIGD